VSGEQEDRGLKSEPEEKEQFPGQTKIDVDSELEL
jgi:hypothetical protein